MKTRIYFLSMIIFISFLSGCGKDGETGRSDPEVIAEVGDSVIDVEAFSAALEVTKLGYPHNDILKNRIALKEDVLTQLIEEHLILNEAAKRNIIYTEEEFQKDLKSVKSEYPDNVLEEVLTKNAIEMTTWEQRFKSEMAIKKSLGKLIRDDVEVSTEELKTGFIEYCKKNSLNPEDVKKDTQLIAVILENVKRGKSEKNYGSLLERLKNSFKIEIHQESWNRVLQSEKY